MNAPAFPVVDGSAFESSPTIDQLISVLEDYGLGWSLDHTGNLIEARVWEWPNVIGRYRPNSVEPLRDMLAKAMAGIAWGTRSRICNRCGKPFPPESTDVSECIAAELRNVRTCVGCLQQNAKISHAEPRDQNEKWTR